VSNRGQGPSVGKHSYRWAQRCDAAAVVVIGVLLVVAVLAVGSFHSGGRAFIQAGAAVVGMFWSLRMLVSRRRPSSQGATAKALPAVVVGILLFTIIPLPPSVVRALSPSAFAAYREALPGWPERPPFSALLTSLEIPPVETVSPLPSPANWRPLSVAPFDTITTLLAGAAYAVIGGAVAFYPWPHHGTRALTRVTSILIGIATFEAMYGFFQFSGNTQRTLWYQCQGGCLGTYLNRDHYAGFLEMVFPLALARAAMAASSVKQRDAQGKLRATSQDFRFPYSALHISEPALASTFIAISLTLLILVALAISNCRSAFGATIATMAIMIPLRPKRSDQYGSPKPETRGPKSSLPFAPLRLCARFFPQTPPRFHRTYPAIILALATALWLSFPEFFAKLSRGDLTRPALATDTFNMARAFPLVGTGLGNFATTFPLYRSDTSEIYGYGVTDAHNDYLQWLAETGFPVGLLTLLLLGAGARRVVKALRRELPRNEHTATTQAILRWGFACGVLTLLIHSLSDFNLHTPANALVFAVLIGALIRLTQPSRQATWVPKRTPHPDPLPAAMRGEGSCGGRSAYHPQMTQMSTDKPNSEETICGHLCNLWIKDPNRNPILRALRAFVVKTGFRPRLLPSAGLTLCTLWLVLTCYCWTAEAAFRQVYPQQRLRDLASAPTQLSPQDQLSLARQAAASVPSSPDYQWGLGDRLMDLAYPAADRMDRAADIIDDCIRAYIRSLWARPLQASTLLDLMHTAEKVYIPDNGPEPDLLIDLAERADRLAPYNAGLRLDIANWYVSQWANLTPPTKARLRKQIEATLEFTQTRPEARDQQKQTAAALHRLIETDAAKAAREEQTQPPRTPTTSVPSVPLR
jgi:O-antigen ligase